MDPACYQAKAKLLLGSYRHVCWASFGSFSHVADADYFVCDEEIDHALDYLMNFPPDEDKRLFEQKLKALFDSKWMIDLVDNAMIQVKEFPYVGELYFELLSKFYLSKLKYGEAELLEIFQLERSTYYERKRESLLVFALAFWGTILPKTISMIDQAYDALDEED
jgi:hypothetical protein